MKKVLIIGGGFGGIRAALNMSKDKNCEVTLISNNPDFEYYPALHKIVGLSDHPVIRVPLETIFQGKKVYVVQDFVTAIDPVAKKVTTAKGEFVADYIIVAVGGQTEYFNIPGLAEMSYGFKSVIEARKLRAHIEEIFAKHAVAEKVEAVVGLHIVVVGAGPNGTDLAGEIAVLGHELAKRHSIAESLLTVDLIEGAPRVLPMMAESVSRHVEHRLRMLGVDVLCNRDLRKENSWSVVLADMTIGAKTLVWTAGITTNELVKKIPGLTLGKKNRVVVDEFLQAKGFENIFMVGDVADTTYSGLAQTALYDASFVASYICAKESGKSLKPYAPHKIAYNIGVGPKWSVMVWGPVTLYGLFAYTMRNLIDVKFFFSILPVGKVLKLYVGNKS